MIFNKRELHKIRTLGKKFNLRLILLYGSYARREEGENSDLDIAVLGKKALSLDTLLEIHSEFVRLLRIYDIGDVDIKDLSHSNPLFYFEVMKNAVLLYGEKDDYDEVKAYAFKLYHDSKNLFKIESILAKRFQENLNKKYA